MSSLRPLRIGGACAFWGDSNKGVEQLAQGGDVDVLVFDYLAELTMSILASAKSRDPELGYASDFVSALKPVLKQIATRKIRCLSNAGGMNAHACARALRSVVEQAGVELSIAVVEGDDLMPALSEIRAAEVQEIFAGTPLPAEVTSLNAYLGAFPVVAALEGGADIVITGRCADSALALAALIHHFGWSAEDYDQLAAGSLVGHMLECTTQATGGLYTDWWRVPGWDNMGFPVAECAADGSFVLTKPGGTGGLIVPMVAAEQMLYEVADPANYVLPDVTCDFTSVTIEQDGENRVRFAGARGCGPTGTYKVSGTWVDGYRLSTTLTIVGDDAADKGRRMADAVFTRTRRLLAEAGHGDYSEVGYEILGSELPSYGATAKPDAREVVLRIAARHPSREALDILSREIAPLGVSAAGGTTGFSGRQKPSKLIRLYSFLWPKSRVSVRVDFDGRKHPVAPAWFASGSRRMEGQRYPASPIPGGERVVLPLSALAVARSGDKGDVAHVALIARAPRFAALIGEQITAEAVRKYFSHLVRGPVTRFDVPGVCAYNFVLQEALGGGGAASLRNDALGKTLGQVLLSHPISVPTPWAKEADPGYQGQFASERTA